MNIFFEKDTQLNLVKLQVYKQKYNILLSLDSNIVQGNMIQCYSEYTTISASSACLYKYNAKQMQNKTGHIIMFLITQLLTIDHRKKKREK